MSRRVRAPFRPGKCRSGAHPRRSGESDRGLRCVSRTVVRGGGDSGCRAGCWWPPPRPWRWCSPWGSSSRSSVSGAPAPHDGGRGAHPSRRRRAPRARAATSVRSDPQRPGDAVSGVLPRDLAGPPGGLALLQLSSQFCADCRASRAVLTDVAGEHPGLTVREVDVAMRPELVRLLGIRRTPTTLVVDPRGSSWRATWGCPGGPICWARSPRGVARGERAPRACDVTLGRRTILR